VRRRPTLAELAFVAYFGVAVVVGLLPAGVGISHRALVSALAFSPADLVSGKLWLLPLSGVVVDGETWVQLAVLAEVAVVLVLMAGARTFWRAAVAAHVGSTLIAYAILAALAVVAPSATGDLFRDPDYGVSCIWAGSVGALAVVAARRYASRRAQVAVAAAVGTPVVVLLTAGVMTPAGTLDLATVEHLFAFVLGALVGRMTTADPHRSGRRQSLGRRRLRVRATLPAAAVDQRRSAQLEDGMAGARAAA
jgi:hypothetical protein